MANVASLSAFLAIPAIALATLFWIQFSATRENRFGVLNDIAVVVALVLLIPPVIAVGDLHTATYGWFGVFSWIAVAGIVFAALGQVLLISGVISLQSSFVTGGIGIAPILAWMVALAIIALRNESPPASVGWSGIVFFVLIFPVAVTARSRPTMAITAQLAMTVALSVWLFYLGRYLIGA